MSSAGQVVVQLVVDSSGTKTGTDQFNSSMAKSEAVAKSTSQSIGTSFESAQKKWQNSLAATDPVLKAQMQMQQALEKQTLTGNRAVELGIATQAQSAAQLEKVKQKHLELVDAAGKTQNGFLSLIGVEGLLERAFIRLTVIMAAREFIEFGVHAFENAAALGEQAQQVGVSVEAFQAYRGAMLVSGIAAEQADQIIGKLTRNIGTAVDKAGPARDAFNELGISFQTLKGGAQEALPAIARGLLGIQDATERARLEVDLFGKSGQKLESALRALIDPTTTLIEKQKALGLVMSEDLTTAADEASDRVSVAWHKMETSVGGSITRMIVAMMDAAEAYKKYQDSQIDVEAGQNLTFGQEQAMRDKAAADLASAARAKSIRDSNGTTDFGFPVTGSLLVNGRSPANDNTGFSTTAMDKYISQQRISADLAGLSVQRRAEEEAVISAANAKLEDGAYILKNQDGSARKFVTSYTEAVGVIGQGTTKEVEGLAATIARGKAWDKVKETVGQYLAQLSAEADAAGQSTIQRATELDIIKAGEISQKARGVIEKDINKTLAFNSNEIGKQRVDAISITETRKILAPIEKQIGDQLKLASIALATNRQERQLALQIAQQELATGVKLTEEDKAQLAATQAKNDATRMKDYLEDLQDEVKLAGMSADERERESAAIQAGHNRATAAQQDEIRGLIATRQETEKWRSVVDDISNGFQGFFEDVLNNGKLSFSSLWDSIKQSFVKMLAYMATQALVAPIIVPIVQGFAGSLGGGGGALGALGTVGSAGSLFGGGGGLLDLGSLFGSGGAGGLFGGGVGTLGASLGFGFDVAPTAGSLFDLGGGLGSISSATPGFSGAGSLFGTSLGGFLGGAGLGSLASSLIFGSKNDASIGGMGGALGGALIGSLFGGPLIGGVLGGLLGGGLGSITGSSNQGAISNFTNNGLGNTLFKAGGGNNGQLATTASGNINTAIKALQDAGVNVSLGNISGLSIGSDKSYVYDFAGGKQKLAGGEAGVQATVNAILDRILPSASSGDDSVNALLQKYGGLNSGNLAAFSTELQAQKDQKAQDAADAATAATKLLAGQFNALGDDLKTYAGTLQDSSKAARDAANNWQKANDNINKAKTALLISAPGLSPTDQYNNSRSQFDSLLNSARGGSSQAASDLASFSSQFLQTSFSFNGSTTGYGSDLSYVKDVLNSLADFSDAQRSFAERQADALDDAVAKLSAIYTAISDAANQNNDGLIELQQEMSDLTDQVKQGNLQARVAS